MTDRQISKKVHDRAKVAAFRDLVDLHRSEYELLRAGWVQHYKQELGWDDERPAANRFNARDLPRGERGRWLPQTHD